MKKLFLLLSLLLCLLLTACPVGDGNGTTGGGNPAQPNGELTYKVNLLNEKGEPMKDIIVRLEGEGESKMKLATDGTASFTLPSGNYRVTVDAVEGSFYYDEAAAALTPEKTETTLTLYEKATDYSFVHAYGEDGEIRETRAYAVGEGTAYVKITKGERNYFLFTPTRGGIYKISLATAGAFSIGSYGHPLSALRNSTVEQEGDAILLEVYNSSIGSEGSTAQFLIGVLSEGEGRADALLKVERVGEATVTPAQQPWTDYQGKSTPTDAFLSYDNLKVTLTDLDITDSALTVVLGTDGYYHLGGADGPLVYLRLSSASPYISPFTEICSVTCFGAYFFDEEGNFDRKESYNLMLESYAAKADPQTGLYPLNEDLAYAVKSTGEYSGWWDIGKPTSLFSGVAVEPKNAWLFACVTVSVTDGQGQSAETPVKLQQASGRVQLSAGESIYYDASLHAAKCLTVTDEEGLVTLTLNGKTYQAENGKITVTLPVGAAYSLTLSEAAAGEYTISYEITEIQS